MFILLRIITVGIVEACVFCLNSKFRQKSYLLCTFISSFVYAFIWYVLVKLVVDHINSTFFVCMYALGFASGDIIALFLDKKLEKLFKKKKYRKYFNYYLK